MKKDKVLVIGAGSLGSSIAVRLSEKGEDVIVLDKDKESFRRLKGTYSGYQITGDATDIKVLEDCYVKEANEVIITTHSDNTNLLLAHICHFKYKVPNVYVRLANINKGKLLENTDIKAIYPFSLSIREFEALRKGGK